MTPSTQELHRRNTAMLARTMLEITQQRVAELANVDASAVTRLQQAKGDDNRSQLDVVLSLIAACNLQVVPRTHRTVEPDEWRAVQVLAAAKLRADAEPTGFGGL